MFVTFIFCILGVGTTKLSQGVWTSKLVDLHHTWLGLAYSAMASGVLSILSRISGQPRPDFIDRCQPNPGVYKDDSIILYRAGIVDVSVCTTTDIKLLQNGFMSFPSGHATSKLIHTNILYSILIIQRSWLCWSCIPIIFPCSPAFGL
jgi:membrane-associated phospholipid phosphatase